MGARWVGGGTAALASAPEFAFAFAFAWSWSATAAPKTKAGSKHSIELLREEEHGLPGMYEGSIAAADFDGDGKLDLVMTGNWDTVYNSAVHPPALTAKLADRVKLFRNVSKKGGPIRFELVEVREDIGGTRGSLVEVGDFDGDRRPDFAIEIRNGDDIASFMNRGGWKFTKRVLQAGFGNHSTSLGMKAVDVDRDGLVDLVFNSDGGGSGKGLWYRWSKKALAWEQMQPDFPHAISYGGTIAAGDLDGDGYPEIAIGGSSRAPFGAHDCAKTLLYGQTHRNRGASSKARGGPGFEMEPMAVLGNFGLKRPPDRRQDSSQCDGMDNAQMAIADLDRDGNNDIVIAGSTTGFDGPLGLNGQQYDFVVLFNKDGSGKNFVTFENLGKQDPHGGSTNGGVGNVDLPSIAIGDLDGDGYPEVFIQGHRRDFLVDYDIKGDGTRKQNPYVFEDLLFVNEGGKGFKAMSLEALLPKFTEAPSRELGFLVGRTRFLAEGGQVIADFNGDGRNDLIFCGAELPFHTNGVNHNDENTARTLRTYVFRNAGR